MGEIVFMVHPGEVLEDEERELLAKAVGHVSDWRSLRTLESLDVPPGFAYLLELEEEYRG